MQQRGQACKCVLIISKYKSIELQKSTIALFTFRRSYLLEPYLKHKTSTWESRKQRVLHLDKLKIFLTFRKFASSWLETALASKVLPVPGGPYRRHPLGGVMPTRRKSSGFNSGSSITCNEESQAIFTENTVKQWKAQSCKRSGTTTLGKRKAQNATFPVYLINKKLKWTQRYCTTLTSRNSRICSANPPMLEYLTSPGSSWDIL